MAEEIKKTIEEYEKYAKENGFKLNPDKKIVEMLIKGVLENEKRYGRRFCPCGIAGNKEGDKGIICPCEFMREEIEKQGCCHCSLFLKRNNNGQ